MKFIVGKVLWFFRRDTVTLSKVGGRQLTYGGKQSPVERSDYVLVVDHHFSSLMSDVSFSLRRDVGGVDWGSDTRFGDEYNKSRLKVFIKCLF